MEKELFPLSNLYEDFIRFTVALTWFAVRTSIKFSAVNDCSKTKRKKDIKPHQINLSQINFGSNVLAAINVVT